MTLSHMLAASLLAVEGNDVCVSFATLVTVLVILGIIVLAIIAWYHLRRR